MAKNEATLLEVLAELEHQQWAHWTEYMLDNLTPDNIKRWWSQIETSYFELSEKEKESDREWARKVIQIFEDCKKEAERRRKDGIVSIFGSGTIKSDDGIRVITECKIGGNEMKRNKTKLVVGQDYLTRGGWKARAIWENTTGEDGFWMIHKPGEGDEMTIPVLHSRTGRAPDDVGSCQPPTYGIHPADVVGIWEKPENTKKKIKPPRPWPDPPPSKRCI